MRISWGDGSIKEAMERGPISVFGKRSEARAGRRRRLSRLKVLGQYSANAIQPVVGARNRTWPEAW